MVLQKLNPDAMQVEEIVEAGSIPPEDVHLPGNSISAQSNSIFELGVYVKAIVKANAEKKIEVLKWLLLC